jgi:hypothetical protein
MVALEKERALMGETLVQFKDTVVAPDGTPYQARACGSPMSDGMWQGWIEFVPLDRRRPVRSPRETTQPNRTHTEYWATGLTHVYLEGALRRALADPLAIVTTPQEPSVFDGPAPRTIPIEAPAESVLNPFSVYEKGEALLRRQLGAFSSWHLVNIITAHRLSAEDVAVLNRRPAADLIEIIVAGVRAHMSHR